MEYELFIGEPKEFPEKLPYIHLAKPELHDFHNHVNYVGDICYTVKSDTFINVMQPEAVLHQALNQAIEVLAGSVERDLTDLYEEFEGYWLSLPSRIDAMCFFSPNQKLERIQVFCDPKARHKILPKAFYKGSLPEDYGYNSKLKGHQSRNAWYLPLKAPTLPPPPDSQLTPSYVRSLLKYMAVSERRKFDKTLVKPKNRRKNKKRQQNEFFLFSQPRPSGALALFGVSVKGYSKSPFFLDTKGDEWKVTPISLQRHYQEYILERGGAQPSLQDISIAVIGCGSVGSRIAELLALSGIGKLILVDDDKLSEDNIYRHVLGGDAIGDYKVQAMAGHLKRRLPYLEVVPKTRKRESWFEKEGWNHINFIVDATADFTGMREMNRTIAESSNPVPVVYCWLEACSLGGHALLVDSITAGCLECLLEYNEQGPYRRCDFLKPSQNVTRDLTGCAGAFTPFSALDAIKIATLSTELVLEHLLKGQSTSYRFWIGDDDIAKREGLRTSDWYDTATTKNVAGVEHGFKQQHCPVCGGRG